MPNNQKLPPEIYYDYIYLNNKMWTKYGIPISFIDPKTKYRVEGLIYSPKKRNREKICKVKVYYNFDSVYLQQPLEIDCKAIFPSKRKLTKIENLTIMDTKVADFDPKIETKAISFKNIKDIYDQYKGVNWTAHELCAILERDLSDVEKISSLPFLSKVNKRNCRITNNLENTYKIDTPEPLAIETNIKFSIEKLEKEYSNCQKCSLADVRKKIGCKPTFGRGNKSNPKIMLIGEAPGQVERDTGIAFNPTAPAGEALHRVMQAAGIDQNTDCYITNSIWCWPPAEDNLEKNGKPSDEQIGFCNSRLKTELAILKPKVIVLLGAVAYKAFFGRFLKGPIGSSLGIMKTSGDYTVYMMYHPSYIIRQLNYEKDPDKKAQIKEDYLEHFRKIKEIANG